MPNQFASRSSKNRRSSPAALAFVAVAGLLAFVVSFLVFYGLGSRVAAGRGSTPPVASGVRSSASVAAPTVAQARILLPPGVDLVKYRDAAYKPVKGIFVSSWGAGSTTVFAQMVALADQTEINAMVIDVKDSTGYVSYDASVPAVRNLKLWQARIPNVEKMIATLNKHRIFPIARIVCFQDPLLTARRPSLAIRSSSGGVWKDRNGVAYLNPYNQEVWKYLVDIAADAVDKGFREIQFDYVRFPTEGDLKKTVYPGKWGKMEDAIAGFLKYARGRLEKKGAWVSADVFGLTVYRMDDVGMGQKIEKVAESVNIVCPMIYPSHYSSGMYNLQSPNAVPYDLITAATRDATQRLAGSGAVYRPWLQDFSLKGMAPAYGVQQVKAEIKAVEDQGYKEWLLWDPALDYTKGALRPDETKSG
jgi:hypothetical protein